MFGFLRILDFVKEENTEFVLTDKHKEILRERRANHISGAIKSYTLEEVMNSLGN